MTARKDGAPFFHCPLMRAFLQNIFKTNEVIFMFNLGDKVVLNGFQSADYEQDDTKETWQKQATVLNVVCIDASESEYCISVSDGIHINDYHPAELRVATKEEIKASEEKSGDKFNFDFSNYFYVLRLDDDNIFIADGTDGDGDARGLCSNDNVTFAPKRRIKQIIAMIPKK